MKIIGYMAVAFLMSSLAIHAQSGVLHSELQAVNEEGKSAWNETNKFPFTIRGIILNDPEEMLPLAYNPDVTNPSSGGQYQIFIQAVREGDRGGTAIYMAQMSPLGDNYDQATWESEMQRVLYDSSNRKFRKGDLIEVTAQKAIFYNGKRNINEGHRTFPENDFSLSLVKANAGLPKAEPITLADIKDANDVAIFDEARQTGGEYYQGVRVRLDGIRLTNTNGWGKAAWADRICTAADNTGRTLQLRMPLTDLGTAPATNVFFSAIGIMNQEGSNTAGYELFVQEIGPVVQLDSRSGSVAVSFHDDYEGYVLQFSDDGLGTWQDADLTPRKVIVVEDDGNAPNRSYRLIKKD